MIRKGRNEGPGSTEEKRQVEDPRRMMSKWIDDATEKRLLEAGFSRKQLYNRRGSPSDRGLASLMEPGDKIIEVLPGMCRIQTREGTIQTYYSLEQDHPFLKKVAPGSMNSDDKEPAE
jgi:hypothetical protein